MSDVIDSREVMQRILNEQPDLTDYGFSGYNMRNRWPVKTNKEQSDEFNRDRARLLEDDSLREFEATRKWLRKQKRTKNVSEHVTSYGLKHFADVEIGYVSNGVFIAAAYAEGFIVKRDRSNALINISKKLVFENT